MQLVLVELSRDWRPTAITETLLNRSVHAQPLSRRLEMPVDRLELRFRHVSPVDPLRPGAVAFGNSAPAQPLVGNDVVESVSSPSLAGDVDDLGRVCRPY